MKYTKIAVAILLVQSLVLLANRSAEAQVLVGLDDVVITPNGLATMDVSVAPTSGPINISEFSVEISIANGDAFPDSRLELVTIDQTEAFEADTDYLFFGVSGKAIGDLPIFPPDQPINEPGLDLSGPNTTIEAIDLHFDFQDVLLNGPRLLTQLTFQHFAGTSPLATLGNEYQVQVALDNTDFSNMAGDPISTNATGGSVTVIPEPSMFTACALVSGLAAFGRRRRSRR